MEIPRDARALADARFQAGVELVPQVLQAQLIERGEQRQKRACQ
jgi:hypothetical protein